MEWAKFGATCGIEVLKIVYDSKNNAELIKATGDRDQYKQEADRLKSQLIDKSKKKSSGDYGHKRNVHENKSGTSRFSEDSTNFSKSFGQMQQPTVKMPSGGNKGNGYSNIGWVPSGGNKGNGYNNIGRGSNHSSANQKRSGHNARTFSGTFIGTFTMDECKTKSGGSNFSSPRGRGDSHGRGRGGGRGNTRY